MAIVGTDSYGPFLDTGTNTQVTVRTNTEVETHNVSETDTATKSFTVAQVVASHIPHRSSNSPR